MTKEALDQITCDENADAWFTKHKFRRPESCGNCKWLKFDEDSEMDSCTLALQETETNTDAVYVKYPMEVICNRYRPLSQ